MPAVERVRAAALRLGHHPQDHGWRELYRLFAHGLSGGRAPQLVDVVTGAHARRPNHSDVHLVTLLGIAVKAAASERSNEASDAADSTASERSTQAGNATDGTSPEQPAEAGHITGTPPERSSEPSGTISHPAGMLDELMDADRPLPDRLAALERLLTQHRPRIEELLTRRQNSFTAARRFLVPQILLAGYFSTLDQAARFADLGTGLGVLPRQLNSKTLFERFVDDLAWPDGRPAFQPIPLAARFGVDRGPLPDLDWVRSCYGPSAYYSAEYHELMETLDVPEVRRAEVQYHELDLTDPLALRRFITWYEVNAVNLSYTLYEIEAAQRAAVIDTLAEALSAPGLIVVTEPHDDLTRPGCTVTIQDRAEPAPTPVCAVSDGHFRGQVIPLAGYQRFVDHYPIRFE